MLSAFLLCFDGTGYSGIVAAKYRAFMALTAVYVLLTLIFVVSAAIRGEFALSALRRISPAKVFALVFLGVSWLSALVSPYFPETVIGVSRYEGALTFSAYCAVFLLVSVFGCADRTLLYVLAGSVTLFCALCFVQFMGFDPFGLYPDGMDYYGAYVDYPCAYLGTIGNTDLAAAFLCVVIPVFWTGLIRLSGRLKYLLLVPLAASLTVLVKINVLAGLGGVFCGGALLLPVALPGKRARRLSGISVAGLIVIALAALYFFDFSGFPHELHELLHGRIDPAFGSGRLHIWSETLHRVPERLWLGHGPDTMLRAELAPFTRYDAERNVMIRSLIDTAHNEYLNVLFHQGVLGLAAYMGLILSVFIPCLKRGVGSAACVMLAGGAFCYCIQAFFGFSMCITAPFFWICIALLDRER